MLNAIAHTVCCRKNLFLGSTSSEPTDSEFPSFPRHEYSLETEEILV